MYGGAASHASRQMKSVVIVNNMKWIESITKTKGGGGGGAPGEPSA